MNLRSLSAWRNRYDRLSLREKAVLLLGLMAIASFFVIQFGIFPMHDKKEQLESTIISKEDDLRKLKGIIAQNKILDLDRNPYQAKRQEASFSLFSVLEKLAREDGLMDSIDHMKPGSMELDSIRKENWVEVKLSRINYKEMVSYLYHLQSYANNIYIKRLTARKNGEYLDLVFQPAVIVMK
ncbi:type II secretion system protein GspM [Thermodesulfobacteriota bacterium]